MVRMNDMVRDYFFQQGLISRRLSLIFCADQRRFCFQFLDPRKSAGNAVMGSKKSATKN